MSYLAPWVYTPFAQALGWTLLHFVWEGALLAAVLAAGLWILRPAPARTRYALACAVLAAMALVFAVTLAVTWLRQPSVPAISGVVHSYRHLALPATPSATPAPPRFTLAGLLYRLAWLVPVWFTGVVFFYLRGLAGWMAVSRMRRRGVCSPASEWQTRLDQLAARLRVSRPVTLLESCLTDTPVLIGYLRPVVLLPLGCLTGLSVAQVECILLHELAHVRRHDFAVNLLQSVIEGLLFYHPAVWWTSGVIRAERENCCDDAVVDAMGDARSYAATLAALEERRALAPQPALAATGGNLMKRIRRLTLEPKAPAASIAPAASAAGLLVLFAAGLLALPAKTPAPVRLRSVARNAAVAMQVAAQQKKSAPGEARQQIATPYEKWVREDVVYIITDEERANFRDLTSDSAREQFIESFWRRRDPTPATSENEFKEEHYRRIAYSNETFAESVPGWKTDRGRIYITYGPPDAIDNVGPRRIRWTYQFIAGIGSNTRIEFEDQGGNGDYHLVVEPAKAAPGLAGGGQATVFVAGKGAAVSVVVPAHRRGAGTIELGDVIQVEYSNRASGEGQLGNVLDREIADTRNRLQALLRNYQRNFPEVQAEQVHLESLLERREGLSRQLLALRAEESEIRSGLDDAMREIASERALAAQIEKDLQSSPDAAAKRSDLAKVNEELLMAQQRSAQLESRFVANRTSQERIPRDLAATDFRAATQVVVPLDGHISVGSAVNIPAAGMTPQQLELALDRELRKSMVSPEPHVRLQQQADSSVQVVTVVVPVGKPDNPSHILGEVSTPASKIVAKFEGPSQGQQAMARMIPLPPGAYHLKVTVRDTRSGAQQVSELNFNVD